MEIVDVRIILLKTKPPVYRDLRVPVDMNLDDFQGVIKIVMPWTDWELHYFDAGGSTWGHDVADVLDRESYRHTLRDLLDAADAGNGKILYTYDFRIRWRHQIKVGKFATAEPGTKYPMLVGAKRACPPEDINGVKAYYHALEARKDPKHPDYEISNELLPDDFDPDHVDLEELKADLRTVTKNMKLGAKTREGEYIPPKPSARKTKGHSG